MTVKEALFQSLLRRTLDTVAALQRRPEFSYPNYEILLDKLHTISRVVKDEGLENLSQSSQDSITKYVAYAEIVKAECIAKILDDL